MFHPHGEHSLKICFFHSSLHDLRVISHRRAAPLSLSLSLSLSLFLSSSPSSLLLSISKSNLFPISSSAFYSLRDQLERDDGEFSRRTHGNKGVTPWNATSAFVVRHYYDIIERNIMWDPTNRLAHFTGEGSASSGLVKKFKEELPAQLRESLSKKTEKSFIARFVKDHDIDGIKSRECQHSFCKDCKGADDPEEGRGFAFSEWDKVCLAGGANPTQLTKLPADVEAVVVQGLHESTFWPNGAGDQIRFSHMATAEASALAR